MDLGAWANEEFRVEDQPTAGEDTLDDASTLPTNAYSVPPHPNF